MGIKVGVNPPKTPVTEGSGDVAPSSVPGVYKMPGPPAPFVPTPLPNIGKSSDSISGATTTVKFEGKKVAKKGTTFKSTGSPDAASKGSGGGVVSSTEQGTTEFVAPGSMNVKVEGGNVQLLGDAMANDDKNGGMTTPGNIQAPIATAGFAEAMGDQSVADELCKAACDAMNNPDPKYRNRQEQMANNLSSGYPLYQPNANTPNILSEVTTTIPQRFGNAQTMLTSGSGRVIPGTSRAAPMSMMRGLGQGRILGRGWTTRWDHVILRNPAQGCIPANVSRYVEVKFPRDTLTNNQIRNNIAMNETDFEKRVEMHPERDCVCS